MHGGDHIAAALVAEGVTALYTLCGGHISPILVGAKRAGIRIVDVRHEVNAVFAADATARLTGIPGVAAVTAGPGVTNAVTALKNAQMAQSPLVLFGGATATALKGRGALQDIDQMSIVRPLVKAAFSVERVRDLAPTVHRAFEVAMRHTPGPVFIEVPLDVLYGEEVVKSWYLDKIDAGKSVPERALAWYLNRHVEDLFAKSGAPQLTGAAAPPTPTASSSKVERAASLLGRAERPVVVVGSQTVLEAPHVETIASALERMGIPVYLSGMARGLLGASHPLQMRHKRRNALKEADVVLLAGVPCDFRLDYGSHIRRSSTLIAVNRRTADLYKNRVPELAVHGDAGAFLIGLAKELDDGAHRPEWVSGLRARDDERNAEIDRDAALTAEGGINPIRLCQVLDGVLDDDSVLVADGGDFVATASYVTRPRRPLSWLDPGVFGTLGVGAGFALGAKVMRPESEVWILYGDGSVGFSIAEFDTFVRHRLPIIALVGNDACWMQIARDQGDLLGDDVGTRLAHTDYHRVVEGFGAKGFLLDDIRDAERVFREAKAAARAGTPVLINARIGRTDFRKGSISV